MAASIATCFFQHTHFIFPVLEQTAQVLILVSLLPKLLLKITNTPFQTLNVMVGISQSATQILWEEDYV